jgi:hypothetical protein
MALKLNPENQWIQKTTLIPVLQGAWNLTFRTELGRPKKGTLELGLIRTKLEVTTRGAIALSILAINLSKLVKAFLRPKTGMDIFKVQDQNPRNYQRGFGNNFGTKAAIV